MQATYPAEKASIRPLILAFAMSAALLLGGAGGYLAKGTVESAPSVTQPSVQAPAIENRGSHLPVRPQ